MEKTSARRARAVVTHSEAHSRRMAATSGIANVTVIPHGVPIPPAVLPSEGKMVLSIGGLSMRKGMRFMLEAIPKVMERVPGATFKIVGIAQEQEAAQAVLRQCGERGERVRFLGAVNAERLEELYDECAVYVSPSTYESFGLTFAEAMAHGRPAIGCNTSAMPEIIRDGVTGRLVEPGSGPALAEAMCALLQDDAARARMGAAAREAASRQFDLQQVTERTEAFFTKLSSI
jgi:hypothetical protein